MSSEKTFFFAVPFFSNANYLEQTLKSLVNQSNSNWSAVVLDDAIDETQSQAAKLAVENLHKNFPTAQIRYSKNSKNLGLAKNWNQGLDLGANSDFTTILHADDCLKKDYCKSILEASQSYPDATAFFCKPEIIDDEGAPVFSFPDWYKNFLLPREKTFALKGTDGIRALIPGNFIFCPTLCFVNKKIGTTRFREDRKQVPDFYFTTSILLKNESLIGLYEKPLYQYRRHSQNTTALQSASLLRFEEERDFYLDLAKELTAHGSADLAKAARSMRIVKLNLLFFIFNSLLKFKFAAAARYFRFLVRL